MENITTRFINVYKHLELIKKVKSGKDFAAKIGISPQLLTEITKGRNEVGIKAIQNTLLNFDFINPNWLLNGIGEMSADITIKSIGTKKETMVPLYNSVASAGKVQLFKDFTHNQADGFISVPNAPKCDGAVPILGDSMYPLLKSGDIVAYKLKDPTDKPLNGEMYLIDWTDKDGDDYLMAKFMAKGSTKDTIKLVSHNKHHDDIEIEIKSIRQLALIKFSVRFQMH
jgi:phage repressor protein C with HTH and peptisase S24 domain